MLLRDLVEVRLIMRRRQALGEPLPHRRQAVVGLVSRRPERVAAGVFGRGHDLEDGIVGRDTFEGDALGRELSVRCISFRAGRGRGEMDILGMPAFAGELFGIESEAVLVVFAVLFG
jgi:hypothetical protein